jgi:O-antigen ligase
MFKDNPIFGHGLKMFRVKCGKKKYYLGERSCTTHPHNIVLTFMSELGTIGLLFYVIIFFYIIKNLIIKNGNQKILLIGFMIYLIPILPSGYFFNNYASIIFYIGIGVYSGLKDIDINRSSL